MANWKLSSLNDGTYEIRLTVFDKSGQFSQDQVRIIVDGTPPKASITSPSSGQQVPRNISITGSAYDPNFKRYIIEYGTGKSPVLWYSISKIGFLEAVVEGTLAEWNSPNLIGEYTLRLTVEDRADQTSNHQIQVSFNNYVDNQRIERVESLDGRARIIFPPHCLTEQTIVTINPTTHGYEFAPWDLKLNPRKLAAIEFMVDGKNEKIGVCR
ncbi:TPA: hypothetical protein EYN09_03275 [Candidatus Poribacteria bacterium]|nr:hypothetical protein [Candidatus Poribacteria bacterium]HIC00546.1 hypothetical protein [Candidatus Poribacteria bacterium]HIO05933.1 hypothetical protein [Candidatus Poribacteria bacterium]HIO79844.1 hypothetical protein [Candidatus Poribacteria bacterium]